MDNELAIRLGVFFGLFLLLAGIEAAVPRRARRQPRKTRWVTNWAVSVLNTGTLQVMALALPALAAGAAFDAAQNGWGLLNQIEAPVWIEVILAILIFDFAIWLQHLITHKVPILWRLHRVHHADRDMDVTTAIRFHPVEIALSMLLKIALVYALGPSVLAIVLFEALLNGTAMFNHANIRLPHAVDSVVRRVLVTPDMHRVHHSVHRYEHDSNYGFSLSIWDRLFGTYIAQPEAGHDDMTVGLQWQDERPSKLGWTLSLPFKRK
ncbi:sterol desaturase family protein [Cognatishimia maritima]|uniref:Sterol desaturase/sphingolipid hydroxylase, fatty acid hydroxylase superfamily n=1 Tax=Cognatishimia maritima TaxID=870908 RepID=A0A1M5MLH2_9RHOB|nr:sterol desaturase family protein [Cognatishimia maritima]SHG77603.1 Sterol desaturase/sphingolipid hydroxylase, fatty acid hydroxylase superfamily [Cognatishimia maritima]